MASSSRKALAYALRRPGPSRRLSSAPKNGAGLAVQARREEKVDSRRAKLVQRFGLVRKWSLSQSSSTDESSTTLLRNSAGAPGIPVGPQAIGSRR